MCTLFTFQRFHMMAQADFRLTLYAKPAIIKETPHLRPTKMLNYRQEEPFYEDLPLL